MTKRHGIGFIGLGSIGQRMLAQGWHHSRVQPVVVWDQNPERVAATVDKRVGLQAAADVDSLINDDAVDVVYIASPPLTHAAYAETILQSGKPVLCEKPLGIDIVVSEALAARATASGICHAVNFIFASGHPVTQIEQALERAEPGEIKGVEVQLHLPNWAKRRYAEAPWLKESDQGGFVREVLSHFVYLTERLFGPAVINYAHCRKGRRQGTAVTGLVAQLSCGDVPFNIHGSTLGLGPDVCNYTIWGEHCSYRVCDYYGLQVTTGEPWSDANTAESDPTTDWYQKQFDQLAAMLDGQPHTLPNFTAALSVQKLIESILEK